MVAAKLWWSRCDVLEPQWLRRGEVGDPDVAHKAIPCEGQCDGSGEVGDPDVAHRGTPCELCPNLLQTRCNEINSR